MGRDESGMSRDESATSKGVRPCELNSCLIQVARPDPSAWCHFCLRQRESLQGVPDGGGAFQPGGKSGMEWLRSETVSGTADGLDDRRHSGVAFDFLAQLGDVLIQGSGFREIVEPPAAV